MDRRNFLTGGMGAAVLASLAAQQVHGLLQDLHQRQTLQSAQTHAAR